MPVPQLDFHSSAMASRFPVAYAHTAAAPSHTFIVAVPRGLRHIATVNRSGADVWVEVVDMLIDEGQVPMQAFRVFRYGEHVDQGIALGGTGAMVIPAWHDVAFSNGIPQIGWWSQQDIDPEELASRPRDSEWPFNSELHVWFARDWLWISAAFRSDVHWKWQDVKRVMHEEFANLIPDPSTFFFIGALDPHNILYDTSYIDDPSTPTRIALVPLVG